MEALPNELKDQIFAYLSCRDFASLRLVNRKLSEHATPLLFETVPVFCFVECLTWLSQLPQELKALIRRLQYFNMAFSKERSRKKWYNSLTSYSRFPKEARELEAQELDEAYALYRTYSTSQRELLTDPESAGFVANVFSQLPGVSELEFVSRHDPRDDWATCNVVRKCLADLLPNYYPPNPGTNPEPRYITRDGRVSTEGHVNSLLAIAMEARLDIRRLSINEMQFNPNTRPNLIQIPYSTYNSTVTQTVTNLQHMSLSISFCFQRPQKEHGSSPASPWAQNERLDMANFLARASSLEEMSLNFKQSNMPFHPSPYYSTVAEITASRSHWPKLRVIDLQGISTNGGDLMDFLVRHSDTLLDLRLANINLETGSWKALLTDIRDSLNLSRYTLGDLYLEPEQGHNYDCMSWHEDRCCFVTSCHKEHCNKQSFIGQLENYLLRRGPWPEDLGDGEVPQRGEAPGDVIEFLGADDWEDL